MPSRIPMELRLQVIQLWVQGQSYEQIEEMVPSVSYSTARNIIGELRSGQYPGYADSLPYLDDIRRLGQQLRSRNLSLQGALDGLAVVEGLQKLGLEPAKLNETLRLVDRLASPDASARDFLQVGLRVQELEKRTGRSYETLEAEYENKLEELKELEEKVESTRASLGSEQQALDRELEENQVTRQRLAQYTEDREALKDFGLDAEKDTEAAASFLRHAKEKEFHSAALELARMERQTGRDFDQQIEEYREKAKLIESQKVELESLNQDVETRETDIANSKQEQERLRVKFRENLRKNNRVLRDLNHYRPALEKLDRLGLLSDLGKTRRVLLGLEKMEFDPRTVIDQITRTRDLEAEIAQQTAQLSQMQKTLDGKKNALDRLQRQQRTTSESIRSLQELKKQAQAELADWNKKIDKAQFNIEMAHAFTDLFLDPSTALDETIKLQISELQDILEAREKTSNLPIDYASIRTSAVFLFEQTMGKKFVPRDTYLNEVSALRRQNEELHFDKLGKLEKGTKQLENERSEFEKEKLIFRQASQSKLLLLALQKVVQGIMVVQTCENCGAAISYTPGATKDSSTLEKLERCPVCRWGKLKDPSILFGKAA